MWLAAMGLDDTDDTDDTNNTEQIESIEQHSQQHSNVSGGWISGWYRWVAHGTTVFLGGLTIGSIWYVHVTYKRIGNIKDKPTVRSIDVQLHHRKQPRQQQDSSGNGGAAYVAVVAVAGCFFDVRECIMHRYF